MSEILQKARDFEAYYLPRISDGERPAFHVTGGIGWINDPNGFSCYRGEYHLFYQYHPYSTTWGPMHWGHMKTRDFVRWERLPVALAPDTDCDAGGCFSGSAVETPDGKQLLMYTGVRRVRSESGFLHDVQTQCVALGDGLNYEKYSGNPVLTDKDVPEGGSAVDFRDPKIWWDGDEGVYYAVVGNRAADGSGAVLLYRSGDGFHWSFTGVLDACQNQYGRMWECPDFFPLDGRYVLIVSPQEMQAAGSEFHTGHGTVGFVGDYDKAAHAFTRRQAQALDYGIDFYAPQTLETPDGRRILIAWMQSWTTVNSQPDGARWFGSMTLPRELSIRDGRLIQNPVRELAQYHGPCVGYERVPVTEETSLPGVQGRILDMTVTVRPDRADYRWFRLDLACGGEYETTIRYEPASGMVRVDRSGSGFRYDIVHAREFPVRPQAGRLKLRAVLDRYSLELFVNDGEQTASFTLYTPLTADEIRFASDGGVLIDVEKYELVF